MTLSFFSVRCNLYQSTANGYIELSEYTICMIQLYYILVAELQASCSGHTLYNLDNAVGCVRH